MQPAGQAPPQAQGQAQQPYSFKEKALIAGATAVGAVAGGLNSGIPGAVMGGVTGLYASWSSISSYKVQQQNPALARRVQGLRPVQPLVLSDEDEQITPVEREPLALTRDWSEKIEAKNQEEAVLRLMGQGQLSGQMLGSSSRSRVFPIRDCAGKEYAVKLLISKVSINLSRRTLFQGEILGFKGNGHNHIVHTYGLLLFDSRDKRYCMINSIDQIPEADRQYYRVDAVITQRIDGADLQDAICGNTALGIDRIPDVVPEPELAIEVGAQVADALCHFHRQGIIYRDLKPENILIDRTTRNTVLIDPEMTKKIGRKGTTSTFCGTPEYIAPEMNRRQKYSYKLDAWTLGILLMDLSCGKTPADYEACVEEFSPTDSELKKIDRSTEFSGYSDARKLEVMQKPACSTLGRNPGLCQLIAELTRENPAERCSVEEAQARLMAMAQ